MHACSPKTLRLLALYRVGKSTIGFEILFPTTGFWDVL